MSTVLGLTCVAALLLAWYDRKCARALRAEAQMYFEEGGRRWDNSESRLREAIALLDESKETLAETPRLYAENQRLREALEACEKNLRVIHEAAGPEPFDESAPSSFAAWEMARAAPTEPDA